MTDKKFGSDLVVDSLINHNVKYVFGIPGAKIDRVFDRLEHDPKAPELIITHHEQGAAFMAQAVGRITGNLVLFWLLPDLVYQTWQRHF